MRMGNMTDKRMENMADKRRASEGGDIRSGDIGGGDIRSRDIGSGNILTQLADHARERTAQAKGEISAEQMRRRDQSLPKGDYAFEKA